jgi:hypothetical protein
MAESKLKPVAGRIKSAKRGFVSTVLFLILFGALFLLLVTASTPSGGPYYFTVPTSTWDYQFGIFSNNTYYAVNGTNWHVDYTSTDASVVIQDAVNALTTGGYLYFQKGIYNMSTTVTLPYGRNYYFYGSGMPSSYAYPISLAIPKTPANGTQFRGSTSFLSAGTQTEMFLRGAGSGASGLCQGTLAFFNLAIMPPWGTTTSGTIVYGIVDTHSAILIEDNVLFMPWGWAEAGYPRPGAGAGNNDLCSQLCSSNGGATEANIGSLVEMGLLYASEVRGYDGVEVAHETMWKCYFGVQICGTWQSDIQVLNAYDPWCWVAEFLGNNPMGICDNTINSIEVESINYAPNIAYLIYLASANDTVTIDKVAIWSGIAQSTYTTITNADNQIVGTCLVYNLGGVRSWRSYPVYQNSGSAVNATATTFLITHGLSGTPSYGHGGVWCSFNTTAITGWTWTANSTTITVTFTGTNLPKVIACYWIAKYTPAPVTGVTLTIISPTNTTYTTNSINVTLSAIGGTISRIWYNVKNGTNWVYGSNQTYTTSVIKTGYTIGSYTFVCWANNTQGATDRKQVTFTISSAGAVTLTIISPANNTVYTSGSINVTLSASGGTIQRIWFNVENGTSWVYGSNQTYTSSVIESGFTAGTYTFIAWANNTLGNSACQQTTFKISTGRVYIFSDGFESGNFNAWTSKSGTYAITSKPVHTGSYAANFTGSNSYAQYTLSTNQQTLYARCYFYIPSMVPNGGNIRVIYIWDSAGALQCRAGIAVGSDGTTYWTLQTPAGQYNSPAASIHTGQWYCMEVRYTAGTGSNAIATLYVDGTQMVTVTTGTGKNPVHYVQIGSPCGFAPAGFVTVVDDCVIDSSYIGP